MNKIFFTILIPILSFATPTWLYKIEKANKNLIIGYGVNSDLSIAKKDAMAEISQNMHVDVDSSADISTSDTNGKVSENSSVKLKTESKATLTGVEYIKVEEIEGIWYVAAEYDNSPIDAKLKKNLPANLENEKQNKYLQSTPLVTELNADIGKKLNYEIVRKNNLWQLQYQNIFIPLDERNFYKLFSNQDSENLSIIPNQQIYKEKDEMFFRINHQKAGYISILYVENNGKVGVLLANQKSEKSFMFPDLKTEDSFQIANPYGKTILELYIAIYSNTPISLSNFENVGNSLLDESNYNFDKLINRLDTLEYATYRIKIRK